MELTNEPKVSVGMPVYNGGDYMRQAIESLLAQDLTDFELIVSDNASSDDTEEICRAYARVDGRIRYFRNETNIGAAPNHTRVFELSRAKYFKWAAHDDVCMPTMLRDCLEAMESAAAPVSLVYPRSEIIDGSGKAQGRSVCSLETRRPRPYQRLSDVLRQMDLGNPMYGLMRKEVLRKTRLIDSVICADYILFAELAMLGEIREVPKVLFHRRLHSGSTMRAAIAPKDLLSWHNPLKRAGRFGLPTKERLVVEYVRSALRLPLDPTEKALCVWTGLCIPYLVRARNTGGLVKRRLKACFASKTAFS